MLKKHREELGNILEKDRLETSKMLSTFFEKLQSSVQVPRTPMVFYATSPLSSPALSSSPPSTSSLLRTSSSLSESKNSEIFEFSQNTK